MRQHSMVDYTCNLNPKRKRERTQDKYLNNEVAMKIFKKYSLLKQSLTTFKERF
jgi:hypothetical protein